MNRNEETLLSGHKEDWSKLEEMVNRDAPQRKEELLEKHREIFTNTFIKEMKKYKWDGSEATYELVRYLSITAARNYVLGELQPDENIHRL
jgi:hypothetical protein